MRLLTMRTIKLAIMNMQETTKTNATANANVITTKVKATNSSSSSGPSSLSSSVNESGHNSDASPFDSICMSSMKDDQIEI